MAILAAPPLPPRSPPQQQLHNLQQLHGWRLLRKEAETQGSAYGQLSFFQRAIHVLAYTLRRPCFLLLLLAAYILQRPCSLLAPARSCSLLLAPALCSLLLARALCVLAPRSCLLLAPVSLAHK